MKNILKLYNTLTRKKEVFKPINPPNVNFYGCGPTVYWNQHIGNIYRYVFEDILYRTLIYNKYKVKHIINVTDVGHLTSDEDEGEDKVELAAKRENKTAHEITHYYFDLFLKDLKKLNIIEPDKWVWASDHVKEQIDLIKVLEKKGYTYKTSDGIYFDTSKLKNYGELAKLNEQKIKELEAGKRIEFGDKKNKTDFALWKFSDKPGIRQQEWNSPWGIGFPGWHIECSAMSSKYLGEQFDIHTGGEEHIPVHHTNEIAQSESAFDKHPWVNYWLHLRWLLLDKGKMSKSKKNVFNLKDLEELGFKPIELRYFFLTGHYRKPLNFSLENLKNSQNAYQRLLNLITEINEDEEINKDYLNEFEESINNDLNIPSALQVLWKMIRDKNAKGKLNTIYKMDEVFGLGLKDFKESGENIEIPDNIKKLLSQRESARTSKNWEIADKIRKQIFDFGFEVLDTQQGAKLKKINNE